jgi:hypothetical protein
MSREDLARRQADLVAALVLGAATPPGFDDRRVHVAAQALTRKRAADVATQWPLLRAHLGTTWLATFERWSAGRAPQGALRDGWDLAREIRDRLGPAARRELAEREVSWRYSGTAPPVRRRAPALRLVGSTVVVQLAGRVRAVGLPQDHLAR